MPKGSKKRNEPTSSPEESPPKAAGVSKNTKSYSKESPETLEVPSPEMKISPSKLEEISKRHRKSRSSIIKNLTDEQASEVGLKIFQKWVSFREKLKGKSGTPSKKSKVEIEDELGATAQKKSFPLNETELPDLGALVHEEIENLESIRLLTESELRAEKSEKNEIEEEEDTIGSDAWNRYRRRKEAVKHHEAMEMMVITVRDTAVLVDRLTVAMSELKIKMSSPSSPEHRPEVHQAFIHDLQRTRGRLNTLSDESISSLKWDTPASSLMDTSSNITSSNDTSTKDTSSEEKPKHPSGDVDDKSELS